MAATPRKTRHARWIIATRSLLALYWLALFIGTHIPRVPQAVSGPDKPLHLVAYAGLAFLLATAVAATTRLDARRYVMLWLVVIAYGAVDEWLQIPVGRSCELADWYADATGAALGLVAQRLAAWLLSKSMWQPVGP